MPSAILSLQDLSKSFGGIKALDGVTFDVSSNQITLLIGPNGSGKTTLFNVISGLIKPDRGRIMFEGRDITHWPPHRIYQAGLCRTFQIPGPFPSMTVLENVLCAKQIGSGESFLFSVFGKRWHESEEEAEKYALKIITLVGLEKKTDSNASTLSGGQLKLLELARALMGGGRLVLLDEPVAGVLTSLASEILSKIRETLDELNTTFLMIEHRLDIALKYADYVHVMNQGRLLSSGRPGEIIHDEKVLEAYLEGEAQS